jgi:hypothetical protein
MSKVAMEGFDGPLSSSSSREVSTDYPHNDYVYVYSCSYHHTKPNSRPKKKPFWVWKCVSKLFNSTANFDQVLTMPGTVSMRDFEYKNIVGRGLSRVRASEVRILPDDQDAVENWIDWIDRKAKNMAREAKAEKPMGLHSESVARTCFGTPMSASVRYRNS